MDQPSVPVLEVYYSPACAPCKLELPLLADLREGSSFKLVVVILNQEDQAFADLDRVSLALRADAIVSQEPDERKALRAAGNENGILPYARVTQGKDTLCQSWRGRLSRVRIERMIASCPAQ